MREREGIRKNSRTLRCYQVDCLRGNEEFHEFSAAHSYIYIYEPPRFCAVPRFIIIIISYFLFLFSIFVFNTFIESMFRSNYCQNRLLAFS